MMPHMQYDDDMRALSVEEVEELGADPWERLAGAIVWQAAEDYRMMVCKKCREGIEDFFRSSWFAMLTDLDPEELILKLQQEGEQQNGYQSLAGTGEIS